LAKSVERLEINSNGRIVSAEDESDAVVRAQRYQISKGIRSRGVDFLNPFVILCITTSHNRGPTESLVGYVRCVAYYKKTVGSDKEILFTTLISTKFLSRSDLRQYVYCPIRDLSLYERMFGSDRPIVCRVYDEEQEQYDNDRFQMKIEYEKSVKMKILKLEKILYNKLKGNYPNINKRVENLLKERFSS